MADINLDINYFEHPKTQRLISKLGESSALIPIRLWCHAAKYCPKFGHFNGYTTSEVRAITKYRGDVPRLLSVMTEVGFIDQLENGNFKLHDWEEHQGHIIAFSERGKANAEKRWSKYRESKSHTTEFRKP